MLSEISQRKTTTVLFHLHVKSSKTKTKNQTQKKKSDLWLLEEGNWMKVIKRCKFPVIRQVSTGDVMYNMMTVANTALWYI